MLECVILAKLEAIFPRIPFPVWFQLELAKKGTCIRLEVRNEAKAFILGRNLGIAH